jgi:Kdo2-lipid IVA lauroyltransferase/acyltransferase
MIRYRLHRLGGLVGVACLRLLGRLPLGWLRGLGMVLGLLLSVVAVPRRRVVQVNLALCFPALSGAQRRALTRKVFIRFAQSWLDRGWLWHASPRLLEQRLTVDGDVQFLKECHQSGAAVIVFAPHFVGLDAAWTALAQTFQHPLVTIYTPQRNTIVDAWVAAGRRRVGSVTLTWRNDGVKPVLKALKQGQWLYLLPDMNFGAQESVFVPFFGVQAATVPSLSRFARLSGAAVVPVQAELTPEGYCVHVLPAWRDLPTGDSLADTALMNQRLEVMIKRMPDQYYWVHKRFKSRPLGEPAVY